MSDRGQVRRFVPSKSEHVIRKSSFAFVLVSYLAHIGAFDFYSYRVRPLTALSVHADVTTDSQSLKIAISSLAADSRA